MSECATGGNCLFKPSVEPRSVPGCSFLGSEETLDLQSDAGRLSMEVGAVVSVEREQLGDFQRVIEALEDEKVRLDVSPQVFLAALASVSKSALEDYLGRQAQRNEEEVHTKH